MIIILSEVVSTYITDFMSILTLKKRAKGGTLWGKNQILNFL